MSDPKVRRDGKCVQCRGVRRAKQKQEAMRAAAAGDPFCSTECCRAYHHIVFSADAAHVDPGKGHDAGKKGTAFVHGTRKAYRLCACPACVAAARMPV